MAAKIVSSGKALHSSEFHEKRRKAKQWRRIIFIFTVSLLVLLPIFLLRLERFQVKEIKIIGTEVLSAEEISQTVQEIIANYYFWLLPKSNALILPRSEIARALKEKFPRIKFLNETLTDARTLKIAIEERVPYALYCQNTENLLETSDCFFLDDEGFIFAQAPSFSGEVYFIYSGLDLEEPLGQRFLEPEEFKSLASFSSRMGRFGISPIAFSVTSNTPGEKDRYALFLSNSRKIFWNAKESLETIESNLNSFFSSNIVGEKKDFLEKILYLDLTVPNKVFYKFNE